MRLRYLVLEEMAAAAHVDRLFVALVALDAVEAEAVVHVRVRRLGVAAGVDLFGDGLERDVAGKALLRVDFGAFGRSLHFMPFLPDDRQV